MIGMRIGWLAMELILTALFLWAGSSIALAFAIVLVLIPVGSFCLHLYVRRFLDIHFTTQMNQRKGENGDCLITIQNRTIFPVLRAVCFVGATNQLNREGKQIARTTWLPAKKQQQSSFQIGSDYCGRLQLRIDRIMLYDCFGLIGVPVRKDSKSYVTVKPDIFEMTVSIIPGLHSIDESDIYSQIKAGNDLSEIYRMREYVPGDSPRQIHWKLSTKFDRLIVREPSLPITRNILIFWERTGDSGNLELIDAQAEVLVSICRNLIDQSMQFTLGWNDTDRNLCILHEISDMDELVGIIPRLMRATGKAEGVSGAGLLVGTHMEALCSHMVYIAEEPQQELAEMKRFGHVTTLACGTVADADAIHFDAEKYEKQLSQIEI